MATWERWSSSSATTASDGDTFYCWSSGTVTAATGDTWSTWNDSSAAGDAYYVVGDSWEHWIEQEGYAIITETQPSVSQTTDAYRADFLNRHYHRMQMKINNKWREMQAEWLWEEKEAAENKAKALLLDLVSEKEFEMYKRTGKLLVNGRKHDYIIFKQGGVTVLSKPSSFRHERQAEGLCVHLNGADKHKCPETDNVIAMKLNIEHAEKEFLSTANHHGKRKMNLVEEDFLKAMNG